jgi:hypothetical protein
VVAAVGRSPDFSRDADEEHPNSVLIWIDLDMGELFVEFDANGRAARAYIRPWRRTSPWDQFRDLWRWGEEKA